MINFKTSEIIALSKAAELVAGAVRSEICLRHGKHLRIDDPDIELGWDATDKVARAAVEASKVESYKLRTVMTGMYVTGPGANDEWFNHIFNPSNIFSLNELSRKLSNGIKEMVCLKSYSSCRG